MKRYLPWFLKTALCLAVIMTAVLAWRLVTDKNSMVSADGLFIPVGLAGEYRINGGLWLPLNKDTVFNMKERQTFRFRGHLSSDIEKNMLIMLRIIDLEVHISQNGQKIYSFGEREKRHPLFRSPGNLWDSFPSPGITKEDEIGIELRNVYSDEYMPAVRYFLDSIHYGSDEGLWRMEIGRHGFSFIIGMIMLILGLLELIAAFELAMLWQPLAVRCLYGGGFSVSCGIWFAIQYSFISLIIPYPALIGTIDIISFYFLGLFFTLYIGTFLRGRRKRAAQLSSAFVLCLTLAVLSAELLGIRDAYDEPELLVLAVILAMLVSLAALWRECKSCGGGRLLWVFYTTLPVGAGIVIDMLRYMDGGNENTLWLGVGVFIYAVAQWSFTIWQFKGNAEASVREEQMKNELAQSRIAIMLSQIQPHFLYNALATIKSLCAKDPLSARNAVDVFAKYLRGNMDSLNENRLISLESELRHVENYLYIEKLRFGERIKVDYNLQANGFMLPALTIQPMVENAVQYGIGRKPEGGTISISTFEDSAGFAVEVGDDGIGFDPEAPNSGGRSHVGIENTRSRLKFMCGGSLEIRSVLGAGTKAIIHIPKEVEKNESSRSRR